MLQPIHLTQFIARKRTRMSACRLALAFACVSLPTSFYPSSASSQSLEAPGGVYLQAGSSTHSSGNTSLGGIGATLPWFEARDWWQGSLSGYWDLGLSQWRADANGGGHAIYIQSVVVPTLRYRWDSGRSPWFVDAGIGASYLDGTYATPDRTFSTQWNFAEAIDLGRSFGAQGRHEAALRIQHFSNAGIRQPNPGETFAELRYTLRF